MSNLDITFDNAYEYDASDSKGSYHYIKNNDVGLRIGPRNDSAMFYEGNHPSDQDFFYPIACSSNGIDRSGSSVTAHFQCNNTQLGLIKHDTHYDNACNRSNVCLNEMKSLHFKFK